MDTQCLGKRDEKRRRHKQSKHFPVCNSTNIEEGIHTAADNRIPQRLYQPLRHFKCISTLKSHITALRRPTHLLYINYLVCKLFDERAAHRRNILGLKHIDEVLHLVSIMFLKHKTRECFCIVIFYFR